MDVRGAANEVAQLAINKSVYSNSLCDHPSLGITHIVEMNTTIQTDPTMSETKICRWLGWMQAAVVAQGIASLDDMKELSKKYADVPN